MSHQYLISYCHPRDIPCHTVQASYCHSSIDPPASGGGSGGAASRLYCANSAAGVCEHECAHRGLRPLLESGAQRSAASPLTAPRLPAMPLCRACAAHGQRVQGFCQLPAQRCVQAMPCMNASRHKVVRKWARGDMLPSKHPLCVAELPLLIEGCPSRDVGPSLFAFLFVNPHYCAQKSSYYRKACYRDVACTCSKAQHRDQRWQCTCMLACLAALSHNIMGNKLGLHSGFLEGQIPKAASQIIMLGNQALPGSLSFDFVSRKA
eukprot:577926-Pelagomonas_calceolata.AAC.6